LTKRCTAFSGTVATIFGFIEVGASRQNTVEGNLHEPRVLEMECKRRTASRALRYQLRLVMCLALIINWDCLTCHSCLAIDRAATSAVVPESR